MFLNQEVPKNHMSLMADPHRSVPYKTYFVLLRVSVFLASSAGRQAGRHGAGLLHRVALQCQRQHLFFRRCCRRPRKANAEDQMAYRVEYRRSTHQEHDIYCFLMKPSENKTLHSKESFLKKCHFYNIL